MLSSGTLGARLAVLRDIVAQPRRPLALGPWGGEDFVDLLIRLIPTSQGVLRQTLTLCLMSYQDPRTTRFLSEAFATSRDAATVLHLGQRLSIEQGLEFFLPFLWGDKAAQALAAARICREAGDLELKDRLRVALLLDRESEPPSLEDVSLPAWLFELSGPHRARARSLAEKQPEGMMLLWSAWDRLPDEGRAWLVDFTYRQNPVRARKEIELLLAAGCSAPRVVETACRLGLSLPEQLLEHPDPAVRARAIASGLADSQLERYLTPETSLAEVRAATRRCGPERLLSLMTDPRWPVRSEAVSALVLCQPRPLARVRRMVRSEELTTRVAAVELLRRWEDFKWLEKTLLASETETGRVRASRRSEASAPREPGTWPGSNS